MKRPLTQPELAEQPDNWEILNSFGEVRASRRSVTGSAVVRYVEEYSYNRLQTMGAHHAE